MMSRTTKKFKKDNRIQISVGSNKNNRKASKIHKNIGHNDNNPIMSRWNKLTAVLLAVIVIFTALVLEYEIYNSHHIGAGSGKTIGNGKTKLPANIGDFTKITSSPVFVNGKIPVLFVGSMACPYCAEESWSLFMALRSSGGNWNNLQYIYSNASDIYPDTPGLSFANTTYSGSIITFYEYEVSNRNWQPYQKLNSTVASLVTQYDPSGHIPFILIGGIYLHIGASYPPSVFSDLSGPKIMNWLVSGTNNSIVEHIENESLIITSVISTLKDAKRLISLSTQTNFESLQKTVLPLYFVIRPSVFSAASC